MGRERVGKGVLIVSPPLFFAYAVVFALCMCQILKKDTTKAYRCVRSACEIDGDRRFNLCRHICLRPH